MKTPFFSIIIPTYNRAYLIKNTIQSVLNQTYSNFELIIVDDGGNDNTKEIVKSFKDYRISYYWKKNEERGAARNFGAKKAHGDYINFVDSDDIIYNHHLSSALKVIETDNSEIFLFNYDILDEKQNRTKKNILSEKIYANKKILKENFISMNSIFIKRNIMMQFPFYEDKLFVGGEDWLQWLKLSVRFKLNYSPISTSVVINHKERSVLNFNEKSFQYRTKILLDELKKDKVFMNMKGKYVNRIKAHMLSYTALHAALAKKKRIALKYFTLAVLKNPFELTTKRTLGIIKNLLLP